MFWRIFSAEIDRAAVARLLARRDLLADGRGDLAEAVEGILARVRTEGDAALAAYARSFDGAAIAPDKLRVTVEEIARGAGTAEPDLCRAVVHAAENIRRFHEAQRRSDLVQFGSDGSLLGLRFVPIERVGVYVPGGSGGTAPLISTVLMTVIPARVAGVPSVAVCSPPRPDGDMSPGLLFALSHLGVDEIYRVGGAQAVAAMAYGTESIAPVAKIVGPGNRFVTEAKRQVFGRVGLDMLAGPSEIAIIADATAEPRFVAADLLAQAEHDPAAAAILFTPARGLAEAVGRELTAILPGLDRAAQAEQSLSLHGGAVITRDLAEALSLVEVLAPEHLELMVSEPFALAERVRNAGAIFLGPYSPEALGDYTAGTNHVLPTNSSARFASCLGVDDFLHRMSLLSFSRRGFLAEAPFAKRLAQAEGLSAHARSLEVREGRE